MRTVTKDWLEHGEDHGFYLIGNEDREDFLPCYYWSCKRYEPCCLQLRALM